MMSSLVLLAYSCQEEQETRPNPTPGQNVQFGVSINKDSQTRTVYGDKDNNNNAFPIYWLKGDQVIVASPQCAIQQGIYQVPDEADNRDYADVLDMVGNAGVQWGEGDKADFYSVYPAAGVTANGTTFSELDIAGTQYNALETTNHKGTSENSPSVAKPGMDDCFMYARTTGVDNGAVVNLGYHPLSTAIRIKVQGPNKNTDDKVQIQSIKLTAPANVKISGGFTVNLAAETPVVTPAADASNEIEVCAYYSSTQGYLVLGAGEVAELNMFVIPQTGVTIDGTWKITVNTLEHGTFTKSLGGEDMTGDKGTLKPGMVHYLPILPPLDADSQEWDPANWMVNIPRNVYLSEISIPGSWNSLNKDFQPKGSGDNVTYYSIEEQYSVGVRAFHLDTRWKRFNYHRVSWGNYEYDYTLGTADGGNASSGNNKYMTDEDNPTFEYNLQQITNHVHDDEYMVVICTFAQNSNDHDRDKGGWEKAISDACEANDKVIDASTIGPNTVVGDVLGHVIVIVNSEHNVSQLTLGSSKCLFTHMPQTLDMTTFTSNKYNTDLLYYGNKNSSGITFNNSHAQVSVADDESQSLPNDMDNRGYAPKLNEREQKVENIFKWSSNNYSQPNYAHNAWIYIGLGGYCYYYDQGGLLGIGSGWKVDSNSYATVANRFNTWIDNKVKDMDAGTANYYPVGIVLMNKVNEYSAVLKDILLLNNKYRKAFDPDWEPEPTGQSEVSSAAPGYSSGAVDNNTNAINWE